MAECSFCGKSIAKGTGKMYVFTSGKVARFCTNKCEKNLIQLKRKPLTTKWTKAYQAEKSKRVASSK